MQDLPYLVLMGICVWLNYRRAKLKNGRVILGIVLAVFLNFIGVGIFYLTTRTRKPPKPPVNSMTSN